MRSGLKATSLLARTLYSELARSGYSTADVVRLVAEVLAIATATERNRQRPDDQPALCDPETGDPSQEAILEIAAFELRHLANRTKKGPLALVCVDVALPPFCPWDGVIQARTSSLLHDSVRASDSVGMLGTMRYALVLPNFPTVALAGLKARLAGAFQRDVLRQFEGTKVHLRVAFAEPPTSARELLRRCQLADASQLSPAETSSTSPPDESLARRAVHRMGGSTERSLVLALGGGAARAAAHAGMIAALREDGLKIAGISGTSAGALVAAMYALGRTERQIADRFLEFAKSELYRGFRRRYAANVESTKRTRLTRRLARETGLAFISESALAVLSSQDLADFVEYFVGTDRDISTLQVPFAVCAMELIEQRIVTFSSGSLHDALRAASALPGMFPPQTLGRRLLVDCSPSADLPIDAAAGLHSHAPVLGVVLGFKRELASSFTTSGEVFSRYVSLVQAELIRAQCRRTDLLLHLPVAAHGWFGFHQAERIYEVGRASTEQALPALRKRLEDWHGFSLGRRSRDHLRVADRLEL
jgi:NTE family protein